MKASTTAIVKIFVLGRVTVADRVKSSIAAMFITVFIAAVFIAIFIPEVKENVTIEAERDRKCRVKLRQVAK